MRQSTFSRYVSELADAVNLQALLDQLADFLLQSGFAGGPSAHPYWGDIGEDEGDRSIDGLKEAIVKALMESGMLTPDMLKILRGDSTGDEAKDAELRKQLEALMDQIVQKLVDQGYLNVESGSGAPRMPGDHEAMGHEEQARSAAQGVQFSLTGKGLDFLGYRTLRNLLGSIGKSSFGSHDTPYLSTGIEAEAASKPYEFGDTLNLDVNATLLSAIRRQGLGVPLDLDYKDLMVHQADYRSSAATVLMLDCSHSMVLYGEDRFTPAKKVALALTHLIRTQFPGDTLKVVLFHDGAEEIPLSRLAQAQVGPYHTNTAEGLKLARRLLMRQRKDMRQIIMITDGKPSALTMPGGRVYVNSVGLDPKILQATYREVALCKRGNIMINTFMLARDRSLVEFVKKVSEICRGKAYFTTTMTLGQFILMDFMKRKTRKVSERMTGFGWFAVAAAAAIVAAVLQRRFEANRRDAMATLAVLGGWDFSREQDTGIGRLCDFEIFNRGENRYAFNTITGRVEYGPYRCELDMGDFSYTVRHHTNKGTSKTVHKFSYLVVRLPFRNTPQVLIRREGLLDKITQAVGFEDIDFESEEFSRKCFVTSQDKRFCYDLIHPRAMEYFLAIEPPALIEIAAGRICVTDGVRRWSVDDFKKRMHWARNFVALWPEHLARELPKRAI